MCGIVGLFSTSARVDPGRLHSAIAALGHRGPDDSGLYIDGGLALGHTRLSIIDLSGGHQPLTTRDQNLALIANGEIYNYIELREQLEHLGHEFLTHSDSEVILHAYAAYGDAFLEHLEGMFAFALYDKPNKRLVIARDRLGIKPLFISQLPYGIAFASEIKALLPLCERTPSINGQGLVEYLQNQFSSGATTILQGVERVLPGEAAIIEQGSVRRRWQYWSPLAVRTLSVTQDEAERRFDALMQTVMQQHMRSDVPFGLFLSGGVDSAILLALLSRYASEPIRTFSVGFAGTRLVDELPLARVIADKFGSHHTEIRPTEGDIFDSLPFTVWAADELMRDNANLPTALLAEAAGAELKVVFSGEGGDEAFAGYGRYRTSWLERHVKALLGPGTGGFRTRGTFRAPWPGRVFNESLLGVAKQARRPFVAAWRATPRGWSDLQRMQYTDIVTALPDNLLVKADRMLMASGVEGRVPLLDHRVVEFGLALPDALKVQGRQGKVFLKRWAARYLPQEHLNAPKRGFYVPLGEWLSDGYRARLGQVLPHNHAVREWFRPEGVAQLIQASARSKPAVRMLLAVFQFALWHRLFIEGDGERPPARCNPLDLLG